MEDAFIGCAVAEDGDDDLLAALHLQSQPDADRMRDAAAHDAVRPQVVGGEIGDVHRAAAPAAVAGILAQELGHHQVDIRTLGDEVPVPAMVVDEVIILVDRHAQADCYSLLPRRKVHGAMHFAQGI